jgi:flagellin-like protein
MKRIFRNKKAVSPVIATVLMILVTMAGMTLLFGFVISYSDSYKAGIGGSVMESLTVEDIWLSPGSPSYNSDPAHALTLSVYNVGKVDSTITSAYVNGLKLTDTPGGQNFNLKETVAVGAHATITLYWSGPWSEGQTYTFRIATQKGSTFDLTYTAP